MHTKALYQTAKGLTRTGVAVLRFNFRGVGMSAGMSCHGDFCDIHRRAALDHRRRFRRKRRVAGENRRARIKRW